MELALAGKKKGVIDTNIKKPENKTILRKNPNLF